MLRWAHNSHLHVYECLARCPFTCRFDSLSDQLSQSLDRLSEHFAKHCTCTSARRCAPAAQRPCDAAAAATALRGRGRPVADAAPCARHRFKRVQYIDCGEAFLVSAPEGGRNIDRRIMPDGVHPNAAGMDSLGLCLDPTVAYLRTHPNAGENENFVDEVSAACAD